MLPWADYSTLRAIVAGAERGLLVQDHTAHEWMADKTSRMLSQLVIGAIGLLLVAAALLKAASPYEVATLRQAYELPRWLIVAGTLMEVSVGSALLVGVKTRPIWLTAVALFGAFSVFSLYRVLMGYESCGCFGPIKVHPLLTFNLDVAAIAGLAALRGHFASSVGGSGSRLGRWAISCLVLAALTGAFMQKARSTLAQGEIEDGRDGSVVILEPETWIGQQFTLRRHFSPQVDATNDDWIVVLFHHDCPKCQEVLPRYETLATDLNGQRVRAQVLLVEVPPYGPSAPPGVARHVRLSNRTDWFVQAPVEIIVKNEIVQSASLDLPSIAHIP
jgi:hypothetical protein